MNIAETIASQMGGAGRLRAMLGARLVGYEDALAIKFPNRQRSKGNYVKITLRADDTYDMEFMNVTMKAIKTVATYNRIYNDQLVEIFEKQTGWYLTF
jgi:hypothetical protein